MHGDVLRCICLRVLVLRLLVLKYRLLAFKKRVAIWVVMFKRHLEIA